MLKSFSRAASDPGVRQHIGDKTYYALGALGGANVYMVQSEMGSGTPGGALITIHKAIEALSPAAVIMVGIAFGLKPKNEKNPDGQEFGHILVAKQIMAYEPGKIKGKFYPRGDRVTCSTALLSKFRDGDMDWPEAKVWFGLVLSGEKLVADENFRAQLLALEPEAIGGEMEGAGLYAAAKDTKTDWILVKAICDWADGDKDDTAQPLAAKNAAEFVRHVIGLGGWGQPGNRKGEAETGSKIHQQAGDGAIQIGQARDVHIYQSPPKNPRPIKEKQPPQPKKRIPNPFGLRGRLEDPTHYLVRQPLTDEILNELRKGVSLSIIGESQSGKSSLLWYLCQVGPAALNCSPQDFIYLNMELIHSEEKLFQHICEYLAVNECRGVSLGRALHGRKAVLCLDEAEKMAWPGFTADVRSELRGLADGAHAPLTLIITSRTPLDRLFQDSQLMTSPLAGLCTQIHIPPFTLAEAYALTVQYLNDSGLKLPKREIERAWQQSSGHPAYLQQELKASFARLFNT